MTADDDADDEFVDGNPFKRLDKSQLVSQQHVGVFSACLLSTLLLDYYYYY